MTRAGQPDRRPAASAPQRTHAQAAPWAKPTGTARLQSKVRARMRQRAGESAGSRRG